MKSVVFFVLIILSLNSFGEENSFLASKDDSKIQSAFSLANKELDTFIKEASNRTGKYDGYGAYIKAQDKGEVEYLWVVDVKPHKDFYIGVVISKPLLVSNVKYESTIGFYKSDIFDWQLVEADTGNTKGAYVMCFTSDVVELRKNGFYCGFIEE